MSDINVITPFFIDGERYLPLGPELRYIGPSSFKFNSKNIQKPIPCNNNNLEEEIIFGTSTYTEKWEEEGCHREEIYFGLEPGSGVEKPSGNKARYKYIIDYYEYDTSPEKNDVLINNDIITIDLHKRIFNAGTKIYKLYYIGGIGRKTFICKKTITQEVINDNGVEKCVIKKVISDTE